jgi:Reverse transcriptase (RNA-dependent DNA polymerase)
VPQGSVLGPVEFIAYTDELAGLINSFHLGHQPYADDTQLLKRSRIADIGSTIIQLQQCMEAIHTWCSSRRLQLNPSKTEVIWFGTKSTLKKIENKNLTLHIGNDVIVAASRVRDLGVTLDRELSMRKHVSKVTSV